MSLHRCSQLLVIVSAFAALAVVTEPGLGRCEVLERVETPDPGSMGNFLNGVSGVMADDVWAVGSYRIPDGSVGSDELPLALHWDGAAWSVSELPTLPAPPNGPSAYLNGVAAFSSDDVWAVGGAKPADDLQRPQTLVFHYDGDSWQKIPSPVANPNNSGSFFTAVAGVSGNDLWAVGEMNENFLAAHWDGSSWTQMPVPMGDLENQELRALSVIASDNVWAVGGTGEGAAQPIVVQWDGSSWSMPIPHPPQSQYDGLWDVKAYASDDIWVAANDTSPVPLQVLVHWDGSSWTSFSVPQYHSGRFAGDDPNDFYSVGYQQVLHWNGSTWEIVAELDAELPFVGFEDAIELSTGEILAVGRTTAGPEAETVAARFNPCNTPQVGDINNDGSVNTSDLLLLLGVWGQCGDCVSCCEADLNDDCEVNVSDLLTLLANWG